VCNKCGNRCVIEIKPLCPFGRSAEWHVEDTGCQVEREEVVKLEGEENKEKNTKLKSTNKITHELFEKDGVKYVKLNILSNGKRARSRIFEFEFLRDLYDELRDKSTTKDVVDAAKKLGLDISNIDARMIMYFFMDNINFDAELVKEGRSIVLVKQDIGSRLKETMSIEKEVIGTPWQVEY